MSISIVVILLTALFVALTSYNTAKVGRIIDPYKNLARNREISSVIFSTMLTSTLGIYLGIPGVPTATMTGLTVFFILTVAVISTVIGYASRKK